MILLDFRVSNRRILSRRLSRCWALFCEIISEGSLGTRLQMEGRASITSFKRAEALSAVGCSGCSGTGCSGIGCSGCLSCSGVGCSGASYSGTGCSSTGCSVAGCLFLLRWCGAMLYKPAVTALDMLLLDVCLQSWQIEVTEVPEPLVTKGSNKCPTY